MSPPRRRRRLAGAATPSIGGAAIGALALVWMIACSPPAPAPAPAPASGPRAAGEPPRAPRTRPDRAPSPERLAADLLTEVNRYRSQRGLPALRSDRSLSIAALAHTRLMARGSVPFSHHRFSERMARLPTPPPAAAENLAQLRGGVITARRVLGRWTESRDHRDNLLGEWTHVGTGAAVAADGSIYVTQIYARFP